MADLIPHRLMTRSMGGPHDEAAEVDNLEDHFPIESIRETHLG